MNIVNSYTSLVLPYMSVDQLTNNNKNNTPQYVLSSIKLLQKHIKVVKNIANYTKLN